jgi:hypothetical protein
MNQSGSVYHDRGDDIPSLLLVCVIDERGYRGKPRKGDIQDFPFFDQEKGTSKIFLSSDQEKGTSKIFLSSRACPAG